MDTSQLIVGRFNEIESRSEPEDEVKASVYIEYLQYPFWVGDEEIILILINEDESAVAAIYHSVLLDIGQNILVEGDQ